MTKPITSFGYEPETSPGTVGELPALTMRPGYASLDNHRSRWRLSSDSRHQPADEPPDGRWMGESPAAHDAAPKIGTVFWECINPVVLSTTFEPTTTTISS